jgi:two-component system, NtrC family, nitrogen regulation response regulator GlnG
MPSPPTGTGLFVFDAYNDETLEALRNSSRNAVVLAIAMVAPAIATPVQWDLLRAGAADVLVWPQLPRDALQISARLARWLAVQNLVNSPRVSNALIGTSDVWRSLVRQVVEVAAFTRSSVLINGESGTGKELVARALHDYGRRRAGPFVAINMAAIPRELIESELFGHERGAFTGATNRSQGRFEQANGGTLFLDEIGDMPQEAQTRLLRVLQEGEFTSVGGRSAIKANVRIIAATHRDLRAAIRQGTFREDLFYRLAVVPIRLPPLRERTEDIADLARHFLDRARADGLPAKSLDQGAIDALRAHRWPGNVRELENLMRRLAALWPNEVITEEAVRPELADHGSAEIFAAEPGKAPGEPAGPEPLSRAVERHIRRFLEAYRDADGEANIYEQVLAEVERPLIQMTLSSTRGNQIKAAMMLGLNRNTLRKKIRDLDIPVVRGIS